MTDMATIAQLMNGPKSDRSHASARARVPMTEAEARYCVAERIEASGDVKSAAKMAQIALKFGNLAPCAAAFYADYLKAVA